LVHTVNILEKDWYRVFILRLSLGVMIAGSLSLQSFAENGLVYPDSALVTFTRELQADTIIVEVISQSADSVVEFYLSDFTTAQTIALECLVDGVLRNSPEIEREFGTVYSNRYTTRWILGNFAQSIRLKYYSANYNSTELSWSAGHPYPIFGTISSGIGPPLNVHWEE